MESIGVKLKLSDFRLVFEALDYDQDGKIDFQKFCMLNTDRRRDLQLLVCLIIYLNTLFRKLSMNKD